MPAVTNCYQNQIPLSQKFLIVLPYVAKCDQIQLLPGSAVSRCDHDFSFLSQLSLVTHIVVDEVHERSEDSDFLLMILR